MTFLLDFAGDVFDRPERGDEPAVIVAVFVVVDMLLLIIISFPSSEKEIRKGWSCPRWRADRSVCRC